MPTEDRRAELAQKALDTYARQAASEHRWRTVRRLHDVSECEIVDLITDLLLLARLRGHDPATIVGKAERHVYAETGHQYGP
ncbi:hypothetical protein [Methylobacterium oxalidis]|uniref:Uncharacterized protein n=1 Tax=Methylobacterium oxalidis TaxID=944322 RepID=A0A512J9C0_9HYPH|nr:hypothetical protein [Methylobacterium oxalidis]GEP06571.1 hypothetical protein MOX02_46090 [Methylobacterium oxalidis]GJE29923.1 hypothetical protein LDDCCGHA_0086 [Methylobacterium oxalidis]GLS67257.1 hypothetical protein GCM10007888_56400 [Methylobacterium oxalidis]